MKRFFNWVLVLAALVAAVYCVGLIVPRSQTLSCKAHLQAKPHQTFAAVADVATWPAWHPDIASAKELPGRNDHPTWRLTNRRGETFELDVTVKDEPGSWVATYTLDGSRVTLRFDSKWYGEGARVSVTRTIDTRDPWTRARDFLWSRSQTSPIVLLNALSVHLGEPPSAEKN